MLHSHAQRTHSSYPARETHIPAVAELAQIGQRLLRRSHHVLPLAQLVGERDEQLPVALALVRREGEDARQVVLLRRGLKKKRRSRVCRRYTRKRGGKKTGQRWRVAAFPPKVHIHWRGQKMRGVHKGREPEKHGWMVCQTLRDSFTDGRPPFHAAFASLCMSVSTCMGVVLDFTRCVNVTQQQWFVRSARGNAASLTSGLRYLRTW